MGKIFATIIITLSILYANCQTPDSWHPDYEKNQEFYVYEEIFKDNAAELSTECNNSYILSGKSQKSGNITYLSVKWDKITFIHYAVLFDDTEFVTVSRYATVFGSTNSIGFQRIKKTHNGLTYIVTAQEDIIYISDKKVIGFKFGHEHGMPIFEDYGYQP